MRLGDALLGAGPRVVAHARGYDVSLRLREPYWVDAYAVYRRALVVTMSEHSANALRAIGLPPERIHVVPYGVDVPDAPAPFPADSVTRLLAAGRLVAKKDPLTTLAAVRGAVHRPRRPVERRRPHDARGE